MQKIMRKLSLAFVFLVLIYSLSACGSQSTNANIGNIKTASAEKKNLSTKLDIAGVLVPSQTINISAKTGGKVATLNGDVGSTVTAGETLITIETKELNAQLAQAQASLNTVYDQADQARLNLTAAQTGYDSTKQVLSDQASQSKINLDSAQEALDRTKQLAASGSAPKSQLDDAQSRYDLAKKQYDMAMVDTGSSAQSQLTAAKSKVDLAKKQYDIATGSALQQAKAAVNSIQVQLDNAIIKSPISGTIINKNINEGEIASPGATLLTIADDSTYKLKGTVPQEDLPYLKIGQQISVSVDIYPNKTFNGVINTIGPMAVSTGEYFPIEISLPKSDDIKAGLSAHATINLATDSAIVVPSSAIVHNNGMDYVYVIKNNTASKRIVTIGLKNDKETEILKDLNQGEAVAVSNVNILFDNMKINMN